MKKIIVKSRREEEYPEDVERIKKVLADRGYEADSSDCIKMWEMYSDSMAAGWMFVPEDDDEVFSNIESYFNK